jgi:hypothetical protein
MSTADLRKSAATKSLHDIHILIMLIISLPQHGIVDADQIGLDSSQPGSLCILSHKQQSHIHFKSCNKSEQWVHALWACWERRNNASRAFPHIALRSGPLLSVGCGLSAGCGVSQIWCACDLGFGIYDLVCLGFGNW